MGLSVGGNRGRHDASVLRLPRLDQPRDKRGLFDSVDQSAGQAVVARLEVQRVAAPGEREIAGLQDRMMIGADGVGGPRCHHFDLEGIGHDEGSVTAPDLAASSSCSVTDRNNWIRSAGSGRPAKSPERW